MPRLVWQLLVIAIAIAVLFAVARGLTPVLPAAAGFARVLLHPWVLLGLVALVFLLRLRPSRPRDS